MPAAGPMSQSAARKTSAVECVAPATHPSTSPRRTRASAKKRLCSASLAASSSLSPLARLAANSSAAAHSRRGSPFGSMISMPSACNARAAACESGRWGSRISTGATTRCRASASTAVSVRSSADSGKAIRRRVALARTRTESRKLTRAATPSLCRTCRGARRQPRGARDR